MATDEVQEARRERLKLAAEKAGGKAALGRLLGYVDGAFVGQMLRGERPVTEDTVLKLEQKAGFQSWFSPGVPAPSTLPFRDLDAFEVQLITMFRQLGHDRQHEYLVDLSNEVNKAGGPASAQNPFAGASNRRQIVLGHDPERRSATRIGDRAQASSQERKRGQQ